MSSFQENGSLYVKSEQGIGSITFSHPQSNSLPSALLHRIAMGIDQLSEDPETAVILIQSEGEKAFCAGASLDELVAIETQEQGKEFFIGFAKIINAIRRCSKLVVCRVHGKAVGGGVGIIAACDYVFATEEASIKLSELTIGIGPFVIEPAVTRKIGVAAMSQLSIDASHWQNAYWAKYKGLYSQVYDSVRDMDDALTELLNKLSNYNPQAMKHLKDSLWVNTEHWATLLPERAKLSGTLVLSEHTKSALKKFKK